MKKRFFKKIHEEGGYTIIETMIAISLFTVIVTLGLGALLNANAIHNKTQDLRSIMDSMSFVMEDMSRNLRTGFTYHCLTAGQTTLPDPLTAKSCAPGNGYGIAFVIAEGSPGNSTDQWMYVVNDGKLFKSSDGGNTSVQITPNEVIIDSPTFISVLGAEPPPDADTNYQQPLVTIRLSGSILYKDITTPFSLQTSVSQRSVDI